MKELLKTIADNPEPFVVYGICIKKINKKKYKGKNEKIEKLKTK
jgi:hypothetical protein